jgi:hypothetical protein
LPEPPVTTETPKDKKKCDVARSFFPEEAQKKVRKSSEETTL